ncbi:hypothetical protein [Chryseobacterium arachidis]|uniref:hypothetical protein n=1 Tax=Chryseobacterium arachidis TaxID=1416778 RepID=UPI0009333676|nr:hypothetical protein [Chryseobacterium arachidis]
MIKNLNFDEGERILKIMLPLGLFEKINSNLENHYGIAVKDREKIDIKIFDPENDKVQAKFNILKLLRIKRF